ncbi:MAG: tRNA (adenine(22)-N(1))-methyltransferase TrmK [Nitrospiraceae bacterium]|nr:MAG: tRNA (adenine(22)-N(1))-methyltransferase TrmK [Nitrospiraceae bacterium]
MLSWLKQSLIVWLIKIVQRYGPRRVTVLGRSYEVSKDVFNPSYYYTSAFMAKHIRLSPDDVVLDMGTGSGIQAITAAQTASKVIAVDINPEAVRYARLNVEKSEAQDRVTVCAGDLFSPLKPGERFSVILFTPPYLQGRPRTDFDRALYDKDKELLKRFFNEAAGYLSPCGYVQMLYSSIASPEEALYLARHYGWEHSIIARGKTLTEEFFIYKLTVK